MPSIVDAIVAVNDAPELAAVRCLQDAFSWPSQYVDWSRAHGGLNSQLLNSSLSTSFSGVCTPSMALSSLILAETQGTCTTMFDYVGEIERDTECQHELRSLPHPPTHLHGDINGFLSYDALVEADRLERQEGCQRQKLETLILHTPGAFRLSAPCFITGQLCVLCYADTHISGSPCTDMSTYGRGKRENGKTTRFFLICVKHRRMLQEPVVIWENVTGISCVMVAALAWRYLRG